MTPKPRGSQDPSGSWHTYNTDGRTDGRWWKEGRGASYYKFSVRGSVNSVPLGWIGKESIVFCPPGCMEMRFGG